MKIFLKTLAKCPLFAEIAPEQIETMLSCLGGTVKQYKKNELVIMEGDAVSSVGVLLAGEMQVTKDDLMGNRSILTELHESDIFAEALACAGTKHSPVSVWSMQKSSVLMMPFERIVNSCSSACGFHARLIENMMRLLAGKNLALTQKIDLLTQRTIRSRILLYLQQQAVANDSNEYTLLLPLSRKEMAEYLSVDRSALSREMCRLRDEGVISFEKNLLKILKPAQLS